MMFVKFPIRDEPGWELRLKLSHYKKRMLPSSGTFTDRHGCLIVVGIRIKSLSKAGKCLMLNNRVINKNY